jgi:3-phenylpropionate/trans-cinnamate dioxygenase ferredoxin reductase component
VENGILVDDRLLTNEPAISAIGDGAVIPDRSGARLRLESVSNAVDQARYVARRLIGEACIYRAPPWFWSNQRTERLQIVGCADTMIRRSSAAIDVQALFRVSVRR